MNINSHRINQQKKVLYKYQKKKKNTIPIKSTKNRSIYEYMSKSIKSRINILKQSPSSKQK
jgi:hypothetical protein